MCLKISMMAMCLLAGCASIPGAKPEAQVVQDSVMLDGREIELPDCNTRPEGSSRDQCLFARTAAENAALKAEKKILTVENDSIKAENKKLKEEPAAAKKGKAKKPKKPRPTHPNAAMMATVVTPDPVTDLTMRADKVEPGKYDGALWITGLEYGPGSNAVVCLIRRGIPISIADSPPIFADMDGDGVADPVPYECSPASGGIRVPAIKTETVVLVWLIKPTADEPFWRVYQRIEYTGRSIPGSNARLALNGNLLLN